MKTPAEVVESALANWGDEKAKAAFEEVKARCERAEADNAALLKRIDAIGHSLGTYGNDVTTQELIGSILRDPHPGAALLEELEGLRKQVAGARDAALEEAANALLSRRDQMQGRAESRGRRIGLEEGASIVRALKKTGQGE